MHGLALTYGNLGSVYARKEKWDTAIEYYEFLKNILDTRLKSKIVISASEKIFPPRIVHKIKPISLNGFTPEEAKEFLRQNGIHIEDEAYIGVGKTKEAITHLEKALEIDEKLGDEKQQAIDLNLLGKAYIGVGKTKEAITHLEKALKIDKKLGDESSQAIDLNLLGKALEKSGKKRYAEAIQRYEESLRISKTLNNKKGISINTYFLGRIHYNVENFLEAKEYLLECLEVSTVRKKNVLNNIYYSSLTLVFSFEL